MWEAAHNAHDQIVFLCDNRNAPKTLCGCRVYYSAASDPADLPFAVDCLHVAIGENRKRLDLFNRLREQYAMPVIVHPRAVISEHAEIGPGTAVLANAVVNIDAVVGNCCIINTGAVVEHDCVLGDGVHISPNATLAGGVRVGEAAWVGMGACVLQGRTLGANCIVGASSVILRDVCDNTTVRGKY